MAFAESFTLFQSFAECLSFCVYPYDTFCALQFLPSMGFEIVHHFLIELLPPIRHMAMLTNIRFNVIWIISFSSASFTDKLCIVPSVMVALIFCPKSRFVRMFASIASEL